MNPDTVYRVGHLQSDRKKRKGFLRYTVLDETSDLNGVQVDGMIQKNPVMVVLDRIRRDLSIPSDEFFELRTPIRKYMACCISEQVPAEFQDFKWINRLILLMNLIGINVYIEDFSVQTDGARRWVRAAEDKINFSTDTSIPTGTQDTLSTWAKELELEPEQLFERIRNSVRQRSEEFIVPTFWNIFCQKMVQIKL